MKSSRFILLSGRDALSRFLLLTPVSDNICLPSCEDDMNRPLFSSRMSFTSEISPSWTPSIRSTTNVDAPRGTVTTLQGGNTPLYLHTLYTDSITSSSSDNHWDMTIPTCAAPTKNGNMYDSLSVSAYSYTDFWNESKTPNYFYNATASEFGNSYTVSSTYYWPGASYRMKFFTYTPEGNGQCMLPGRNRAGPPTVSITIPNSVDDQKDLLVTKADELTGNTNTAVPLTFNHALTAIRFVYGGDMRGGTVKSVSLKDVCSKRTYNMGTRSWSNLDTPTTFSQVSNRSTTRATGETLTTDAQIFMMVPQTLSDGAQLEVMFADNSNVDHMLTADIKGTSWLIGKTVIYKVSSSSTSWSYALIVAEPNDFAYTGDTR